MGKVGLGIIDIIFVHLLLRLAYINVVGSPDLFQLLTAVTKPHSSQTLVSVSS